MQKIVGVDLAGVAHRPTGLCILTGRQVRTEILWTDSEIISKIKAAKPALVAIDAPLSLPKAKEHFRKCDLELKKAGIRFFPVTLGPMRKLTERGIRLKAALERLGLKVVEVYPGGAQDIFGIPRAKHGLAKLRRGLLKLGIKQIKPSANAHELDAITCALVGKLVINKRAVALGNRAEGKIFMPVR